VIFTAHFLVDTTEHLCGNIHSLFPWDEVLEQWTHWTYYLHFNFKHYLNIIWILLIFLLPEGRFNVLQVSVWVSNSVKQNLLRCTSFLIEMAGSTLHNPTSWYVTSECNSVISRLSILQSEQKNSVLSIVMLFYNHSRCVFITPSVYLNFQNNFFVVPGSSSLYWFYFH
jgi:hypothetical protein